MEEIDAMDRKWIKCGDKRILSGVQMNNAVIRTQWKSLLDGSQKIWYNKINLKIVRSVKDGTH